ncbi:MAG: trypsin-like serine protease [Bacteroidetes bacterium]|nr:trypsin-like serine protease [Bacteroidota bacterium]
MKNLNLLALIFLIELFTGCTSTVSTTRTTSLPPTPASEQIIVYGLNDAIPPNAKNIGMIKIGDSGFSIDCGWDQVLESAKLECRKIGGNAIKLASINEPDIMSTCYRITAYAMRLPQKRYLPSDEQSTKYTLTILKEEWAKSGVDEIEGVYEAIGDGKSAKYILGVKKINNTEYSALYFGGAVDDFSNNWVEGDLKAKIFKTATPNIYRVEWYMADKSINTNLYITFEKGMMRAIWTDQRAENLFLKLYPTSESVLASINPEISSSGTGFAINNSGYILTNNHVIENAGTITVKGINSDFRTSLEARVVVRDKNNDLALLKIIDETHMMTSTPYVLNPTLSEVGETVFALGYPLRATMGDEIKLTNGIISSRTGFQGDVTSYQVSVPVQPGNSGGPLFDSNGNVIGVISSKHIGAENVSYAIKIDYLLNMIELSGEDIDLNKFDHMSEDDLPSQVKKVKEFVYIIECR